MSLCVTTVTRLRLNIDTPIAACSYRTRSNLAPMRVLIADDHKIIRKSISSILQSRADIQICGEATNGEEEQYPKLNY